MRPVGAKQGDDSTRPFYMCCTGYASARRCNARPLTKLIRVSTVDLASAMWRACGRTCWWLPPLILLCAWRRRPRHASAELVRSANVARAAQIDRPASTPHSMLMYSL
jgi:hypothetical protein